MNDLAIWTEKLVKVYSDVRAVDGLSMNVPRGVTYGFLGRNGAGKTSTIKILLGLMRPTAGRGTVLGFSIGRDQVAILERTAFVSESKTLYGDLSPRELVRFTRGFYPKWSDQAVTKYSHLFEIPMDRPFSNLSQGNRTKVYLMLALSQGADLLVLDEPTMGLDPLVVDEFLRVLVEDVVGEGHTVFVSSHQLADVEQIADCVGLIDHGRLLLEARLDDIKSQFRLITAAGNALPQTQSAEILLVASEGSFCKYLVRKDADAFAAELSRQGATIAEVSPLGLREIFLELVRKEEACTSGNVGGIAGPITSCV
ncbi:MAG: ABC transporter ATP-binding protein [Terriglobia bacterium]|jgi:ABC-2 type transport system ATP-binding protein